MVRWACTHIRVVVRACMAKAKRMFVFGIRPAGVRTMAVRIIRSLHNRNVLSHVAALLLLLLPMMLAMADSTRAVGVEVWRCLRRRQLC